MCPPPPNYQELATTLSKKLFSRTLTTKERKACLNLTRQAKKRKGAGMLNRHACFLTVVSGA